MQPVGQRQVLGAIDCDRRLHDGKDRELAEGDRRQHLLARRQAEPVVGARAAAGERERAQVRGTEHA